MPAPFLFVHKSVLTFEHVEVTELTKQSPEERPPDFVIFCKHCH